MATVVLVQDDSTVLRWDDIELFTEHEILSALGFESGGVSADVKAGILALMGMATGVRTSDTGACLCTSFRRDTRTDMCLDCQHRSHSTRHYCGGLR